MTLTLTYVVKVMILRTLAQQLGSGLLYFLTYLDLKV